MAVRNIPINLPNGQEDALITEYATYHGWTVENSLTAPLYIKSMWAEAIREDLKDSRKTPAVKEVVDDIDAEVNALNIS